MSATFISNRTVAFIDVFAFKFILNKYEHDLKNVGEIFTRAIDHADEYHTDDKIYDQRLIGCKKHVFSDSIIIYSLDDSENGCISVIRYAQRVLQMLILRTLPARAAITFGEAYINEGKNIHIGKNSFTKAYELEQSQNWIGGILDTSLINRFPELFINESLQGIIKYDKIPFKKHKKFKELDTKSIKYAINWVYGITNIAPNPIQLMQNIFENKIFRKCINSEKFLNHVLKLRRKQELASSVNRVIEPRISNGI